MLSCFVGIPCAAAGRLTYIHIAIHCIACSKAEAAAPVDVPVEQRGTGTAVVAVVVVPKFSDVDVGTLGVEPQIGICGSFAVLLYC